MNRQDSNTPDYTQLSQDIATSVSAEYKPEEPVINPEETPEQKASKSSVHTFASMDEINQYEETVLKPRETLWENEEIKEQFLQNSGGDEEKAHEAFIAKYEEALDAEFDKEIRDNAKVQMTRAWGEMFDDMEDEEDWYDVADTKAKVLHQTATISGRRRIGDMWTAADRSTRGADTDGSQYVNDLGEVVALEEGEVFASFFGTDEDAVIRNDKHTSADGKHVVGFEYLPTDQFARRKGALKAVYEGERAEGELVSMWDLGDTWLRSNKLSRGNLYDIPVSVARGTIGLLTNLVSASSETFRSLNGMITGNADSAFMQKSQSFNTMVKSYAMSKTDEDQAQLITWANALDLIVDITGQVALAAATSGGSVAAMAALNGSRIARIDKAVKIALAAGKSSKVKSLMRSATGMTKTTKRVAAFNTMFVYGAMAGDGIKEEAIKAGYSERAASILFLSYMGVVGGIGATSNLIPSPFKGRVSRNLGKQATKEIITKAGALAPPTTAKGMMGLARRLKHTVDDMYEKYAAKMVESSGMKRSIMAGGEEAMEENMELVSEVALKHLWEAAADYTGQDPDKKGFTTINDPAFWEELPVEFLMSTVAGFAGGVLAHKLPWTGGKNIPNEALPFKGDDLNKVARIARSAALGEEQGIAAEAAMFKQWEQAEKDGTFGSLKFTITLDESGKRFKSKTENPDGYTIGQAVHTLAQYQYYMLKEQFKGDQSPDFDTFLENNKSIKESLANGDYMLDKFVKKTMRLAELTKMGNVSEILGYDVETKKDDKKKEEPKKDDKKVEAKDVPKEKEKKAEETKEEATDKIAAGEATPAVVEKAVAPTITDGDAESREEADIEVKKEKKEKKYKDQEVAKLLAGTMGVELSTANEVLLLQEELKDMVEGATVERDFTYMHIRRIPELSVLVDDEELIDKYGEDYVFQLIQADYARMNQEQKEWEGVEKNLEKVAKDISAASTIEQVTEIAKYKNKDGKILMTQPSLNKISTLLEQELNAAVTPEEFEAAKLDIIKKLGLYDPRSEEEYAKDTSRDKAPRLQDKADELQSKVQEEYDKRVEELKATKGAASGEGDVELTFTEEQQIFYELMKENKKEIAKISASGLISTVHTPSRFYNLKVDLEGDHVVAAMINDGSMLAPHQLGEVDRLSFFQEGIEALQASSDTEFIALGPLLRESLASVGQDKVITQYEKISEMISTNIPKPPTEDVAGMMMRGFDFSGNTIKTTQQSLMSFKEAVVTYGEDTEAGKSVDTRQNNDINNTYSPIGSSMHDIMLTSITTIGGTKIFRDVDGAKAIKKQLQIREALASLYLSRVGEDGTELTGMRPFIGQIASIRERIREITPTPEFYSTPVKGDYNTYSKYYSNYIIDPELFVNYDMKAKMDKMNDTSSLSEEELRQYEKMLALLDLDIEEVRVNARIGIESMDALLKLGDSANVEKKFEEAYRGGVATHASEIERDLGILLRSEDTQLTDDHRKMFAELLGKFKQYKVTAKSTDEELEFMFALIREYAEALYTLPVDIKAAIMKTLEFATDVNDTTNFLLINYNDFYERLAQINLGEPPTIEQDVVSLDVFAAIVSKEITGLSSEDITVKIEELEKRKKEELADTAVLDSWTEEDGLEVGLSVKSTSAEANDGESVISLLGEEYDDEAEGIDHSKSEEIASDTEIKAENPLRIIVGSDIQYQIRKDGVITQDAIVQFQLFNNNTEVKEYFEAQDVKRAEARKNAQDAIELKYARLLNAAKLQSVDLPSVTSEFGIYKNIIFSQGKQGTGKTTIIVAQAIKIAQQLLDERDGTTKPIESKNKALIISVDKFKEKNIVGVAEDAGINIKHPTDDTDGMSSHAFFELIQDKDKAEEALEDVTILILDEATLINAGTVNSDLGIIAKSMEDLNAKRRAEGKTELTLVLLGDVNQGGWVEGMPRLGELDKTIDYDTLEQNSSNVGTLIEAHAIRKTRSLKYSFRVHVAELDRVKQILLNVSRNRLSNMGNVMLELGTAEDANAEVDSNYGPLANDGDNPKMGGVDFVKKESDIHTQKFADHIKSQIDRARKAGEEFTVMIVTDNITDPLPLDSPIVMLMKDPAYANNIQHRGVSEVQGDQADYVIGLLSPRFLTRISITSSFSDVYKYQLMSMIVGRARYFARVMVNDTLPITSSEKDMFQLDTTVAKEVKDKWRALRAKLIGADPATSVAPVKEEKKKPVVTPPGKGDGSKPKTKTVKIKINTNSLVDELEEKKKIAENRASLGFTDPNETDDQLLDRLTKELKKFADTGVLPSKGFNKKKATTMVDILTITNEGIPSIEFSEGSKSEEDKKVDKRIENITGKPTTNIDGKPVKNTTINKTDRPTNNSKQKEDAKKAAKALDKEGYGLAYLFNPLDEGKPTQSTVEANSRKVEYIQDIYGEDNTLGASGSNLERHQILAMHTRRAAGLSSEGKEAMQDYKYKLVTYFYHKDKDPNSALVKGTAIVAITNKGKAFILTRMASTETNVYTPNSNMYKFIKAREDDLETAKGVYSTHVTNNPRESFSFNEHNKKGNTYTAGEQALRTRKSGQKASKLPYVYVEYDLTQLAIDGKLFEETGIGTILTDSNSIAKKIKTFKDKDGNIKYEKELRRESGPAVGSWVYSKEEKDKVKAFKDMQEFSVEEFEKVAVKYIAADKHGKKRIYRIKGDKFVMLVQGTRDTTIPFVYDAVEDAWSAFYGIDVDGNLIEAPEGMALPKVITDLTSALDSVDTSEDVLQELTGGPGVTPINTVKTMIADVMHYKQSMIDKTANKSLAFSIASTHLLYGAAQTRGSLQITVNELREVSAAEHGVDKNAFKISVPLIFTKGPHAGRAFLLYTYRDNPDATDITSPEGVTNIMDSLIDISEGASFDSAIGSLQARQGVGVVLLNAPSTDLLSIYEGLNDITKFEERQELNRSTSSASSVTAAAMHSIIMEIALAMRRHGKLTGAAYSRLAIYESEARGTTLDTDGIDKLVNTLLGKALNGTEEEKLVAKQFFTIIASTVRDVNLGVFKRTDASPDETDVTDITSITQLETREGTDIPKIFPGEHSPLVYFPASSVAAVEEDPDLLEDRFGFNMAALMDLFSINEVEGVPITKQARTDVIGIFDSIIGELTVPGVFDYGIQFTPAVTKSNKSTSSWGFAEGSDLENTLTTTAKAFTYPALIFSIGSVEQAIEEGRRVKVAPVEVDKKQMERKVITRISLAAKGLETAGAKSDGFKDGMVLIPSDMVDGTEIKSKISPTSKMVLTGDPVESGGIVTGTVTIIDSEGKPEGKPIEVILIRKSKEHSVKDISSMATEEIGRVYDIINSYTRVSDTVKSNLKKKAKDQITAAKDKAISKFQTQVVEISNAEVNNGTLDLTVTEADPVKDTKNKEKAEQLSKKLPIIVTDESLKGFKTELDAYVRSLTPDQQAAIASKVKSLKSKLTGLLPERKKVGYIKSLKAKVDTGKITLPATGDLTKTRAEIVALRGNPADFSTQEILEIYLTDGVGRGNVNILLLEYLLAGDNSKTRLDSPIISMFLISGLYPERETLSLDVLQSEAYLTLRDNHPELLKMVFDALGVTEKEFIRELSKETTVSDEDFIENLLIDFNVGILDDSMTSEIASGYVLVLEAMATSNIRTAALNMLNNYIASEVVDDSPSLTELAGDLAKAKHKKVLAFVDKNHTIIPYFYEVIDMLKSRSKDALTDADNDKIDIFVTTVNRMFRESNDITSVDVANFIGLWREIRTKCNK